MTATNAAITTNGLLSVLSGATFQKIGTFTLTVGPGGVSNAGTLSLNGTTAACGEADTVSIRLDDLTGHAAVLVGRRHLRPRGRGASRTRPGRLRLPC